MCARTDNFTPICIDVFRNIGNKAGTRRVTNRILHHEYNFHLCRSSTEGDLLGCKGFFPTFWRLILVPCRSPSSYGLTRKSTIDCLVPLLSFADTATAVPFGRSRTCAVDSPRCQSPLLSIFDNDGFFLENHVLLVQWQHFLQRQHFFICRSWKVSRTHPSKSSPRANSASSHY